jgi:hypothetical protein
MNYEIEIKNTAMMELHPLTATHPVMNNEQYEAFKLDIAKNGQLQPVLLYKGKIIDGRHRLKALKELGVETIITTKLPNNTTLDKVKAIVLTTEKRRHQSPTQLAIRGYREYKNGMKQSDAVAATGCSLANLKHVVALEKLGRLDIIDLLEKGGKFDIGNGSYRKFTDSLLGIVQWVKATRPKDEPVPIDKQADEWVAPEVDILKVNAVATLVNGWSTAELQALLDIIVERSSYETKPKD